MVLANEMKTYSLVALSAVAFVLLVLGGGTPSWATGGAPTLAGVMGNYHYGPFTYFSGSDSNYDHCSKVDADRLSTEVTGINVHAWRSIQAFVILCVVFSFLGVVSAGVHAHLGTTLKADAATLQVMTGIFGLVATVLWVHYATPNQKCEVTHFPLIAVHTCGWSFILFTVGWVLAVVSAGAMVLYPEEVYVL